MFCPAQRPQAPGVPHLNQLPGLGAPSIRSLIADGWETTNLIQPHRPLLPFSSYLHSTRLSCAATICHAPPRFSQVSVQTWHTFVFGCDLSLPTAYSLP